MRTRSGTQREKTTGAKATASKSWGKAHMPQGVAKLADTPGRVELIFERWRKIDVAGAPECRTQRYMVGIVDRHAVGGEHASRSRS